MMEIAGRRIGVEEPPFIIAELSGNHNGSLERALAIVDAAAEAGAHALKLQTYTASTMTLNIRGGDFEITDPDSPWYGRSLYELYEEAHTPWEWHDVLFRRAREKGMVAFSSPFDETAVDFLESLDVPCYKVASFENVDLPLIEYVAKTGKPIIMSTGLASLAELDDAVRTARAAGCGQLALLKCTSAYPANPNDSNLRTIPHLREMFGCEIGLSDHTLGIGVAVASVALGATIIEKHVTLDRDTGGVDSAFSLDSVELKALVEETERAGRALGGVHYGPTEGDKLSLAFRRSLYIAQDVMAGETLAEQHVRRVRPGFGLLPGLLKSVIGLRATRDLHRGEAVGWDMFQ